MAGCNYQLVRICSNNGAGSLVLGSYITVFAYSVIGCGDRSFHQYFVGPTKSMRLSFRSALRFDNEAKTVIKEMNIIWSIVL